MRRTSNATLYPCNHVTHATHVTGHHTARRARLAHKVGGRLHNASLFARSATEGPQNMEATRESRIMRKEASAAELQPDGKNKRKDR